MTKLKSIRWEYVVSFFLPIIIAVVAYGFNGIYLNSARSILASDSFTQGATFLSSFHDVLNGKNSLLYNWNAGLGVNYLSLYSYYLGGIVTPLIVFFSKSQIPNAFYVLTLIKFGLAGISIFSYLKRSFKIPTYQAQILAISYALMAFGIVNAEQIMWLDVLYILPMIVLGIDRFIQDDSVGLLFLSWLLMIVTNFYMAFIVGIFMILYFVIKMVIVQAEESIRIGFKFFGILIWSTLSSSVILLPLMMTLGRNKNDLSTLTGVFTDHSGVWDLPIKSMVGSYDGTKFSTTPYIYVGLLALIFAVSFFFNKKYSNRIKIGYGLLLASIVSGFYLQFFNLTWQGWHFPAMFLYRYSFLWSFVVIMLAACELEQQNKTLEIKVALGIGTIMLIAMLGSFNYYKFVNDWNLLITLIFIVIYVLIFKSKQKNSHIKYLLFGVFLIEITVNTGLLIQGISKEWHYPSTAVFKNKSKDIIKSTETKSKGSVFRLESLDPISRDDGIRFNYGSVNFFSSIVNRPFEQKMNLLGYKSSGNNLNMTYGNNTLVMDSILGIQKNLAAGQINKYGFNKIKYNGSLNAYSNTNALKTATLVNTKRAEDFKLSNTDNLGNQNQLLSLVSDSSINRNLFSNQSTTVLNSTAQHALNQNVLNFNNVQSMPGYVNIKMVVPKNKQAYLSVFKTQGNITQIQVYKNNQFVESYNPSLVGQYVDLGFYKQQTTLNVRINITGTGNISILRPSLITLDTDVFKNKISKAKDNGVNLTYGKRTIAGTVNAKANQSLMLTVPYEPGWKATVNGKNVKVKSVDNTFCLIPLTKGVNKVKMTYTPSGFIIGMFATIIGIVTFVVIFMRKRFKDVHKS